MNIAIRMSLVAGLLLPQLACSSPRQERTTSYPEDTPGEITRIAEEVRASTSDKRDPTLVASELHNKRVKARGKRLREINLRVSSRSASAKQLTKKISKNKKREDLEIFHKILQENIADLRRAVKLYQVTAKDYLEMVTLYKRDLESQQAKLTALKKKDSSMKDLLIRSHEGLMRITERSMLAQRLFAMIFVKEAKTQTNLLSEMIQAERRIAKKLRG